MHITQQFITATSFKQKLALAGAAMTMLAMVFAFTPHRASADAGQNTWYCRGQRGGYINVGSQSAAYSYYLRYGAYCYNPYTGASFG